LQNFSLTILAGKTTALVGASGCGKSTIIQLLERFYDPDEGNITLDGEDIRNLNLRKMRQLIGYVGQEPVLFNTSIRENMLFAKPDATEQEIQEALIAANAWDFIKDLEKGIDT
jgi:ATP-binding cassette, subfamily B (MDR/TAP), member 1